MFVLNVNTDTDTRFLIHSIIDLLYAKKVRRDYLENILYAMLQMEEFLYIDSIIVDNTKALYKDINNGLSKSYIFNFRLNGDILKIKERWDKVYIPCNSDVNFATCKKCYKQERVIMEDIVPLYIDTEVVIYSFLKGFKFIDVIEDYPSKEFKNRSDYLKHMLNLSKKVCEDLDKYIINRKNVLLADSNEKDKEKILGSDFVNTFLKRGFNINNMCVRIGYTEND